MTRTLVNKIQKVTDFNIRKSFDIDINGVFTTDSVNLAISHDTVTPLAEGGSLKIVKAASNQNGAYVYIPFSISEGYFHSRINVSFLADTGAGFVDNDMLPIIRDLTNAADIPLLPEGLLAGESSVYRGSFHTSADGTDYELRFKVNNANTNGYALRVDNFEISLSSPTPWIDTRGRVYTHTSGAYTITATNWTTISAQLIPYKTKDGIWRIKGNIAGSLSSASTAVDLAISGITSATGQDYQAVTIQGFLTATGYIDWSGAYRRATNQIELRGASADYFYISLDVALASKPTWAIDDYPQILGEDASTRITAGTMIYTNATDQIWAAGVNTVTFDAMLNSKYTGGNFDLANNQFVAEYSGWFACSYRVIIRVDPVNATAFVFTYMKVNGTGIGYGSQYNDQIAVGDEFSMAASCPIYLNKGDSLKLYVQSGTQNVYNDQIAGNYDEVSLSVMSINAPQQIAAGEKVFAHYGGTDTTITNGVYTTINYDTKITDTHNAVNTGASWEFVTPKSDVYRFTAQFATNSSGWALQNQQGIRLEVNSVEKFLNVMEVPTGDNTANAYYIMSTVSGSIWLNKGQIVRAKGYTNRGTDTPVRDFQQEAYITIESTGL